MGSKSKTIIEQSEESSRLFEDASLRKSGTKKLGNETMHAREFNIISNRYHELHDKRVSAALLETLHTIEDKHHLT